MHRSTSVSVASAGVRYALCVWVMTLSFGLLATGCSSTGLAKGSAAQVRFFEYRSAHTMTVVNESHTDRVQLYSEKRDEASTKVARDEVMEALIERVRKVGFANYAEEGPAPATSSQWSQGIEVKTDKGTHHMLVGPGVDRGAANAFRQSREAFLGIYNNIFGAQSVNVGQDEKIFERRPPRRGD